MTITVTFKNANGETSTERFNDAWGNEPYKTALEFAARWNLTVIAIA